jgi:competence protein ComEA
MPRRTAGPAASTPARADAGREPVAGRPGAGRRPADAPDRADHASRPEPANRLAARLGGPHSATPGPGPLLELGDGREFSYGSLDGPRGDSRASEATAESRVRWRLGLRAAVLLGIVSLVAGGWFWWQVAAAEPEVLPLSAVTSEAAGTAGAAGDAGHDAGGPAAGDERSSPGATTGSVVVHVAGAVKKTGVVRVSRGGRVHEAIAAAGGGTAAADLNRLNLAAALEDGQKIYVPRRGEAVPPDAAQQGAQGSQSEGTGAAGTGTSGTGTGGQGGSSAAGGSGSAAAAGKINLNTATAEELGNLPRVGPVLAQRIVDWRKEHGLFKTAEELDAVDGVGPKMLETLLPLVTV